MIKTAILFFLLLCTISGYCQIANSPYQQYLFNELKKKPTATDADHISYLKAKLDSFARFNVKHPDKLYAVHNALCHFYSYHIDDYGQANLQSRKELYLLSKAHLRESDSLFLYAKVLYAVALYFVIYEKPINEQVDVIYEKIILLNETLDVVKKYNLKLLATYYQVLNETNKLLKTIAQFRSVYRTVAPTFERYYFSIFFSSFRNHNEIPFVEKRCLYDEVLSDYRAFNKEYATDDYYYEIWQSKFDLLRYSGKETLEESTSILNCLINNFKHGFPSGMSDDPVLNLLLSEADQFENGEERRLFYVAMTRARESVYFVADNAYKSKFIAELETESPVSIIKKCPKCITADLSKKSGTKNGKDWAFYGCTNYIYGCTYKERVL